MFPKDYYFLKTPNHNDIFIRFIIFAYTKGKYKAANILPQASLHLGCHTVITITHHYRVELFNHNIFTNPLGTGNTSLCGSGTMDVVPRENISQDIQYRHTHNYRNMTHTQL